LIDEVNPRLAEPNVGQREAQRTLAHEQGKKILKLAKHILQYGLNPLELPAVSRQPDGRFIVLEGNRRLVALKALDNPDTIADAVTPGVLSEIRKLSKKYQQAPIDFVECVEVKDREEIEPWIRLKHTGENQGAGLVRWGPDESDRFFNRSGLLKAHTQALEFLTKRGDLTADARAAINTTTFQRLIDTPEVRDRLGIELKDRRLYLMADAGHVANALMHVIEHLPPVTKLHSKAQRVQYAKELPSKIVVRSTIPSGSGIALMDADPNASPTSKKRARKRPRQRISLIPTDCVLNVTDDRAQAIEEELRHLRVEKFANAVSVLMRVFIEVSMDCYFTNHGLPTTVDAALAKKLQDVAHDLVTRGVMTSHQAKAVNRAASADSFLAPSVKLMNAYVHNAGVFPAPGDLFAHWNTLQPFMTAVWKV
jgi:hypothetical protein